MQIYRISYSEAMLADYQQKNHVNFQDFPFRGYAGRLSVRNHVNLQDFLSRGDADIYQRESCELVAIPDQRPH